MEYNRRHNIANSSRFLLCKAIAAGVLIGLLISLAGFVNRHKYEALKAELEADIHLQERVAEDEKHRRELAEQLQVEADTERTTLQGQLKEVSASVLEAQASERTAKELAKALSENASKAEKKLQEAEERAESALTKLKETAEKLRKVSLEKEDLQSKLNLQGDEVLQRQPGLAADRHHPWDPSSSRDAEDPQLAALLRKIAIRNEVVVAISNKNLAGKGSMLDSWIRHMKRLKLGNAMVVALDEPTKAFVEAEGVSVIHMTVKIPDTQKDVGDNHAVSGLKFRILQRFLQLGYAVLLSDVDIITLQNPFDHLYRDSDVEAMSDGWDNATAYGYNDVLDDPSMGWARYAHSMRVFCFNSGLFYIRPTAAALQLLQRVMTRIETESGWDQAIFNEVIFFPSRLEYKDPAVTRRVMDMFKFMNSKVLFKQVRYNENLKKQMPVMLHANYHANKAERLKAAEEYFLKGDDKLLMKLPEGS